MTLFCNLFIERPSYAATEGTAQNHLLLRMHCIASTAKILHCDRAIYFCYNNLASIILPFNTVCMLPLMVKCQKLIISLMLSRRKIQNINKKSTNCHKKDITVLRPIYNNS